MLSTASLVASSALGLLVYLLVRWISPSSTSRLRGPRSLSLLTGYLSEFGKHKDIGVAMDGLLREHGPISRHAGLLGAERLVIADPRTINHIFARPDEFPKISLANKILTRILGEGLIVAEGDVHRRQRKVMLPSFAPSSLRVLLPIFLSTAYELRDRLDALSGEMGEGGTVDMYHWWGRGTLDVIGKAGFDYSFGAIQDEDNELAKAFTSMFNATGASSLFGLLQTVYPILGTLIPTKAGKAMTTSLALMRKTCTNIVSKKKSMIEASTGGGQIIKEDFESRDLISQLLRANIAADLPAQQRLTDEEVANQVTTMLLAGFETSSTALTWISDALAAHPEVQHRLRTELLDVADDEPTMDELNALSYLDAVVKEGMRLFPPVPEISRVAALTAVLPVSQPFTDADGNEHSSLKVDKGTEIVIPVLSLQRQEEVWGQDAHEFKPERWLADLPEKTDDLDVPWAHLLTFVAGPRSCIGYRFALLEIKAFLFVALRSLHFSHPEPKLEYWRSTFIIQRPVVHGREEEGSQLRLRVKRLQDGDGP